MVIPPVLLIDAATAHAGATDCEGIRKTMKYELAAKPFVPQISGTKENAISVAILPAE
jgi:hypothetical protein